MRIANLAGPLVSAIESIGELRRRLPAERNPNAVSALPLPDGRPAGERGDRRRGHHVHRGRPGPGRRGLAARHRCGPDGCTDFGHVLKVTVFLRARPARTAERTELACRL